MYLEIFNVKANIPNEKPKMKRLNENLINLGSFVTNAIPEISEKIGNFVSKFKTNDE